MFKELNSVDIPFRRRVLFVALLTREIKNRGERYPIVVGGEAFEIYTQGSYTTGDIDLKIPKKVFEDSDRMGFHTKRRARSGLTVDWLGESLDEGSEAEKRVNTVLVKDDLEIKVLSIEDLNY
jgi:hypothetical protein